MKKLTDEELMLDVSRGNLDAMAHIFERYNKRLYNFYFQMIRDKAICEDMTQTVFYKVIRYRTSYKGGQFVSWIFKIARNVFSDQYQKSKKTSNNENLERVVSTSTENKIDRNDDLAHLQNALNTLSIEERELIVLNRIQGIKYAKIADIVGSSEGAVKVKVHRIIKKLKTVYLETI
ncbi:RNA polymerase sigma factor [Psychroserpens sp. SPM9]|uniref:RNA polymerase sigma factor n=1 Tax=Psychroserpens sp. SPM9 TaxID=2975598 RepID=UPI0021A2EC6C|nr:RNA polymerase sigma factor [Psychroserpens sp. SPM9]MDG5490249.1 RNA polymerase sigma factor [Psychroserpens sp. SPM9]